MPEIPPTRPAYRWLHRLKWLLALILIVARLVDTRLCFEQDRTWFWDPIRSWAPSFLTLPKGQFNPAEEGDLPRVDNNDAHVQIDFGGQWLLARMLVSGHGRQLYHRRVQRQIAEAAFPIERESPTQKTRDADQLLLAFMGEEPPEAEQTPATDLSNGLGGPLYPPLQAFFFAPYALGNNPQRAYFAHLYVLMACALLAAWGISRFTRGALSVPMAIIGVLLFPGMKPGMELGQNPAITLMILVWGWVYRERGRVILGGVVWGLLAYKPVWAMSFFFALLFLREYRMAAAMIATGAALGLATLPWVGLQSWFDWLKVGKAASDLYAIGETWIPLSRDLFGLPRRFLVPFSLPEDERWNIGAHVAGWVVWLIVFELTVRVFFLVRSSPYREPFILLSAWLLTYHFVYYDAAVAAFPLFALIGIVRQEAQKQGKSRFIPSFPFLCYLFLVFLEYVVHRLQISGSFVCARYAHEVAWPDGHKDLYPRMAITFDEWAPWNTLGILVVWWWCALQMLQGRSAAQSIQR